MLPMNTLFEQLATDDKPYGSEFRACLTLTPSLKCKEGSKRKDELCNDDKFTFPTFIFSPPNSFYTEH